VCALGCGAEGTPAPATPSPSASCPTAEEALEGTRESFHGDDMTEARANVGEVLGERGGIKVILSGLFALLDDADESTWAAVETLPPGDGLGPLGNHVIEVLHYLDGSGNYTEPHPAPAHALFNITQECPAALTLSAMADVLALDTKTLPDGTLALAPPGTVGDRPWLAVVMDAVQVALESPALVDALAIIELDGQQAGDGSIHVGRDAFQTLFHLVAAGVSAPDFDRDYTRQLIDDVLLRVVDDPAARADIGTLLDVAFMPLDQESPAFVAAQGVLACVNDADTEYALAGMLYDWLTVETLSPGAFLDDVSEQAGTDAATALRAPVIRLFRSLAARPSLAADSVRVLSLFVDDARAPVTIRTVILLKGRGLVAEVLGFLDTLQSCR
jgi:hypothetical protein